MAAAMRITLLAVAAMAVLSTASAATYDVGPSGAWELNTDYATWASSKTFLPGDSIVFKYPVNQHDVLEVKKADYDSCNKASPINPALTTGNDVVALSATGPRYFICGISTHCSTGGMKVTIDVVSGSSPSPPAPASSNSPPPSPPAPASGPSASNSPPPSPPAPASGPSASNSPPPPQTPSAATSVRATAGLGLVVLLAGLMS